MDTIAREIWEANLAQKRQMRAEEYERCLAELNARGIMNSGSAPLLLFKIAGENLADLALQWRDIYQDYWRRESPADPQGEQNRTTAMLEQFFSDETAQIQKELADVNQRKGFNWPDAVVTSGGQKLGQTLAVVKPKCIALIQGLAADTKRQRLREDAERRKKWVELLIGNLLSLAVGGFLALFGVWLTNRGNRANLEPLIELTMGDYDHLGIIGISSDTLRLSIANVGPTQVKDVQVFVDTFHASPDLGKIALDALHPRPTFTIDRMSEGLVRQISFGNDDRFVWANVFKNEKNVYAKDPRYKGMLLFLKLHARYRRALDKRLFTTTRIYHATQTSLIPWNFPQTKEEFFSGNNR